MQAVNRERIDQYLFRITEESISIEKILENPDNEIIASTHLVNSLKYSLIVISETIANMLQHLLARKYSSAVKGYTDAIVKAKEKKVLNNDLIDNLKPFFHFRNMLAHQYWIVDDRLLIENVRKNGGDLKHFITAIHKQIS